MDNTTLVAKRRTLLGTKHTRRLRQTGQLPAVIYGHGEAPETIALDRHEVEVALLHHSRVLGLNIEGSPKQYLIKAVQYDHLGTNPMHLDLMRVRADERVQVSVEVELKGVPKGAHEGGVLMQLVNDLQIECSIIHIPDVIRGVVSDLGIDESLSVKDLDLPEGVTVLSDANERVAVVRPPTAAAESTEEEELPEGGAEASGSEPEVIGRKKEDGQEGGG